MELCHPSNQAIRNRLKKKSERVRIGAEAKLDPEKREIHLIDEIIA